MRLTNRFYARRAAGVNIATGFTARPEPGAVGSFLRGRDLLAGRFRFAGVFVHAPGVAIWDVAAPSPAFAAELHGFGWLDDLAAVANTPARVCAQDWTREWFARFERGSGPGWAPELTGRRLMALINHAGFLLEGQEPAARAQFLAGLGAQTLYLSWRWQAAAPGLARIEALTGLIRASLALTATTQFAGPAAEALGRECAALVDPGGGIASRNPQELLDLFALIIQAAATLGAAGRRGVAQHTQAIARIAPVLRALRHADGGLARFHGGGRGAEGRLDQALVQSGVRGTARGTLAMGYARLAAGRSTVIVDAAAPPQGAASATAHASTLAFEMSSGRRPFVVNCGSGVRFGESWRQAGRATASHSTLAVDGLSSSRFGKPGWLRLGSAATGGAVLVQTPGLVVARQSAGPRGQSLFLSHDGYVVARGLTHVRQLELSHDGRELRGEDTLGPAAGRAPRRHARAGVRFGLRFHLHPDVGAELDDGGGAVLLTLNSGEIWVFRHDGTGVLALEPSVYLEHENSAPLPARQIVLAARVTDRACQLRWTLAKAQDTPQNIRDLKPAGRAG